MKRILYMVLALFCCAHLACDANAQEKAVDAEALKAGRELMTLMSIHDNLDKMTEQIMAFAETMVQQEELTPEQAAKAKAALHASMKSTFDKMREIDFDSMFAEIYAEVFTAEEIRALIDFFKSPTGSKYLEKQQQLATATMQRMQVVMKDWMPDINKEVEKAVRQAEADAQQ